MKSHADVAGKGKAEIPFAEVPIRAAADYCGADSATVLALHRFFEPMLEETGMKELFETIEMPLVPVITEMEWHGIAIDPALFGQLSRELSEDLARLELPIGEVAGGAVNLTSPRQLAAILFEKQQLQVLKKTKTGPST